ncbi:hypothetical protein OF83DRAFT_716147 [Amylostereum chailletii]|nr:hypothetical protein OF83DRAFT_716147 [Amylostereum chailletii]
MAYKHDTTYGPGSLPHVGVPSNEPFGSLVRRNRFLFRVQDDNSQAKHDTNGFVAGGNIPQDGNLTNAAIKHLDQNTRSSPSPFISLSFNLAWAIQDAHRRQHSDRAHPNTRIAVVDGLALLHKVHAQLGVSIVDVAKANGAKACSRKRLQQLRDFADVAQEVLVLGKVPASAIIGVVPWEDVVRASPSWFFKENKIQGGSKIKGGVRRRMNTVFVKARQDVVDAVAVEESVDFAAVLLGMEDGDSTDTLEELAFYIYWWPLPTERRKAARRWEEDGEAIRKKLSALYGCEESRSSEWPEYLEYLKEFHYFEYLHRYGDDTEDY